MSKSILIGVPCMSMIHVDFLRSIMALRTHDANFVFQANSLVYDARNRIAMYAAKEKADRILWLDSDMTFEPDLLERLEADMDEGIEMVSGLYFKRSLPTRPCLWKKLELTKDKKSGRLMTQLEFHDDYPKNALFETAAVGFGAVMMSLDLVLKVFGKFDDPPFSPIPSMGEDLSFCWKVRQLGIPIFCDSRVTVGHIGTTVFDERTWEAQSKGVIE